MSTHSQICPWSYFWLFCSLIPLARIIPALWILISSFYPLVMSLEFTHGSSWQLGTIFSHVTPWHSSKYHRIIGSRSFSEYAQLRKELTDSQQGKIQTQWTRTSWFQSLHSSPSLLMLSPVLWPPLWPAILTCSQFAPLSMVLGSRASCKFSCQPNLLNQFIFCFHQICSQHTLIQCHEKNYGFLEDARAGSELILLPLQEDWKRYRKSSFLMEALTPQKC
jgi:hypothetical protein